MATIDEFQNQSDSVRRVATSFVSNGRMGSSFAPVFGQKTSAPSKLPSGSNSAFAASASAVVKNASGSSYQVGGFNKAAKPAATSVDKRPANGLGRFGSQAAVSSSNYSATSASSSPFRHLLSDDDFHTLTSSAALDELHTKVATLVHKLQKGYSVDDAVGSEKNRGDLLNAIDQDLSFISNNSSFDRLPQNRHNQEMVRYLGVINKIILPPSMASSLAADGTSTAAIKLKNVRQMLVANARDKNQEEIERAKMAAVAVDGVGGNWRESFSNMKMARNVGVAKYVR